MPKTSSLFIVTSDCGNCSVLSLGSGFEVEAEVVVSARTLFVSVRDAVLF